VGGGGCGWLVLVRARASEHAQGRVGFKCVDMALWVYSLQYFTEEEAAALGGYASQTGGDNLAFDYAPVMIGYQNCQVRVYC
jgi:hypothetical protein